MSRLNLLAICASALSSTSGAIAERLRQPFSEWGVIGWFCATVLMLLGTLVLWVWSGPGASNPPSFPSSEQRVRSELHVPGASTLAGPFGAERRAAGSAETDAGADETAAFDSSPGDSALDTAALGTLSRYVFPLDRPSPKEASRLKASIAALQQAGTPPARRHVALLDVRRWQIYLATPARPPLAVMRVSSFQGWRTHPITKETDFHRGIDLAAPENTPVYAPGAGEVVATGYGGGYGLYVILDHLPTPYRSLLGHLSRIDVEEGDQVEPGAMIGAVGSTGLSTGPHLHFEVQLGEERVVMLTDLYENLLQQRDSIASAARAPATWAPSARAPTRAGAEVLRSEGPSPLSPRR